MAYNHLDSELSGQQYEIRRQKKIEMLKIAGEIIAFFVLIACIAYTLFVLIPLALK
jgi:hypothetical protein